MKISVIIPTYRPQGYLWECLGSMAYQTFPKSDFEVILVLNGCCEPYRTEIENYIETKMEDLNIKQIQVNEGGVSNARNIGLDNANGDYITFIDDDDYVSPYFLEGLYNAVSESTVSVCSPKAFIEGQDCNINYYPIEDIYNKLHNFDSVSLLRARRFFSGPCMKLIPKEFIGKHRYDVRFKNGEDSIFMFQISDKIKNVKFAPPEAVYYRRYREGSAMTTKRSKKQIIGNNVNIILVYCKIFFRKPFSYNPFFFITRILATINSIIAGVKKL